MKTYKVMKRAATTIKADIFDVFDNKNKTNKILAHQANCFHTMGAGIALEIKRRYPAAFEADLLTPVGARKMGTFSYAFIDGSRDGDDYRGVANVYSQGKPGPNPQFSDQRATSYDAVYDGIDGICNCWAACSKDDYLQILVPYGYGCGIARGNWDVVSGILDALSTKYSSEYLQILICKKE